MVGYFKDRPGYTNHFQGNLVVQVVNNDHLVWVPSYGGVTSVAILTRAWTRETSVAAAKLPTFTAVVCNIEVSSAGSTCAAEVADKSPQRSNPPTGTVTFSALSGTIGKSCALAGTPGSPGIASCTISYTPSANLVQGEPPPVTATYAGDATFAPSSGGSSYKPASVLVPNSVIVDLTSSTGAGSASSGGIPTDLSNQNAFPVSADEQLTIPGNTDTIMIRLGTEHVIASRPKVIGRATFHLSPLTSITATVKLTATGRTLLAKHKLLHAVLAITTHAPGKPTKTITHQLTIKAR